MADGNGQQNPQPPDGRKPGGPNVRLSRNFVSWLFVLGLVLLLVTLLTSSLDPAKEISISEFYKHLENKHVAKLTIKEEDGKIEGELVPTEGTAAGAPPERFFVEYPRAAIDDEFLRRLIRESNAEVSAQRTNQFVLVLLSMLPWILIFAFIWFVIFRQIRNAGGGAGMLGSFGRSRHRVTAKEHTNVTFADVAGIEEAKEEVQEIIEFLKAPKKFQRLGARVPRGILLVGEPGCGKTLLAKAIAGEAEVPFFSISGSDFVEMFVGVGASRVRDLFKQAKENSPCIIFLDEIDAVGRRRGANFGGGGHDEREQTLNAILVEMDGFETNSQIIVIAATNRADVLDPALVRPGRFDRQVYVSLPDLQGRYEILKVHLRKVKLGPNVDIKRMARGTPMFSGAELSALVNEAAIVATLRGKEFVEQEDLEEARDKVRWGRAKKSPASDERDRKLTAYHEAGHALIQALEKEADPLHKVSIIPRGPYGGATFSLPERDRMVYSRNYLLATMRVLFGGRLAEEIFFNEVSSGAAADIKQVTEIAQRMVREWGMGENVGFIYYGDDGGRGAMFDLRGGRDISERTAEVIDSEVKRLVDAAHTDARRILTEHREKLEAIALALLKFETITGDEVNALIRGESLDRKGVADLLDSADARPNREVGVARPAKPKTEPGLGDGMLPQPG
ncbi:MAG: ATP-dependent zinc metalloprotease FtsH [Phycisphaerae bacterium]|nr:ATP-dependent zinc metalloprotease FtsH [Phycisphaerae bacterium]